MEKPTQNTPTPPANGDCGYLVEPCLDLHPMETQRVGGEAMHPRYLFDVDGKFPYTVYEKKPELYDLDGKYEYKYFSQMKHLERTRNQSESNDSNSSTSSNQGSSKNVLSSSSPPGQLGGQGNNETSGPHSYDLDGKFNYTVYNSKVHKHLFSETKQNQ